MKRELGRTAISALAWLVLAVGGAGTALAGQVAPGSGGDGPALIISQEATALASGFKVTGQVVPLAPLGVFQADTSRPVEAAWNVVGLNVGADQGPGRVAVPAALSLPALAEARSKALASGAGGGLPDGTTGRPSDDFSYLGLGPKMFAILRSGTPAGGLEQWSHSSQTALSYVQPHRQLEFVVKFFGENKAEAEQDWSLSAAPIRSQEQLVDNLHVDVDSANMRLRSQEYGRIDTRTEHKEPPSGRMVAFGMELGLLPAVVGNVGLNSELIIGRSSNPGFYIGMATNVALPVERGVDRGGPDLAYRPPYDFSSSASEGPGISFGSGDMGGTTTPGTGGGGGGTTPFTPVVPITPTPEPGTLLLLAAGSAWLMARRRAAR